MGCVENVAFMNRIAVGGPEEKRTLERHIYVMCVCVGR
jgi:hypothetical protein